MRILSFLSLVFSAGCLASGIDAMPPANGTNDPSPPGEMRPPLKLSFATPVSLPAGRTYAFGGMVVGDLDGDGRDDIAVTAALDNKIGVILGRGDGTFRERTTIENPMAPMALAVDRFSGGTGMEVATMTRQGRVSVFANAQGTGTFPHKRDLTVPLLDTTTAFVSGDFSGDGKPDLVGLGYIFGVSDNLCVLVNDGNSNFTLQPFPAGARIAGSAGMVAGDYSGDGKLDLAFLDPKLERVTVWANSGNTANLFPVANINDSLPLPAGSAGDSRIFSGDFNGDGKVDLATASGSYLSIFLNRGGSWAPPVHYAAGAALHAVAVADFDLDGLPDVAVADQGIDSVAGYPFDDSTTSAIGMLLGKPDGSLGRLQVFNPGRSPSTHSKEVFWNRPTSLIVRDFNQDGKPDLVTVNTNTNTVSIILNTSTSPTAEEE